MHQACTDWLTPTPSLLPPGNIYTLAPTPPDTASTIDLSNHMNIIVVLWLLLLLSTHIVNPLIIYKWYLHTHSGTSCMRGVECGAVREGSVEGHYNG